MTKHPTSQLCPAQQTAFDNVRAGLGIGSIIHLRSGIGRGKSTILRELHRREGGALLGMQQFIDASAKVHPQALEETLYRLVLDACASHSLVLLDDAHLPDLAGGGCHFYPRSGFMNTIMMGLCSHVLESGKKLVFSTLGQVADPAVQRSYSFGIERFKVEDYAALAGLWLAPEAVAALDLNKIFRFAPKLNAHQLKAACRWLARNPPPDHRVVH